MSPHPLIEARKRAGLSQLELGQLIGRDRLTVLRIEQRQTNPPLETIAKIISVLRSKDVEMSADDFMPKVAA